MEEVGLESEGHLVGKVDRECDMAHVRPSEETHLTSGACRLGSEGSAPTRVIWVRL